MVLQWQDIQAHRKNWHTIKVTNAEGRTHKEYGKDISAKNKLDVRNGLEHGKLLPTSQILPASYFVNKALCSHTYSFTCRVWLLSCDSDRVEQLW